MLFGPFYLFKGIQARLPCKPSAEPSPTIKWLKDGVALRYVENGSYSLNSDGTLVINKVDDSDSGRYTCVAENYFGKANVTASGILRGEKGAHCGVSFFFYSRAKYEEGS